MRRQILQSKQSTCTSLFVCLEKKTHTKKRSLFVQWVSCRRASSGGRGACVGAGVMHACTVCVKWVGYCTDWLSGSRSRAQEPDSPVEQPRFRSHRCPQQFLLLPISPRSWPELALKKMVLCSHIHLDSFFFFLFFQGAVLKVFGECLSSTLPRTRVAKKLLEP